MKILKGYLKGVDIFNEWVAKIFAWLIIALILGMVYSTIMRYVFNEAPLWTYDFTYNLYAAFFMLGAAYTLRLKGHVRVDVFYRLLSPRWQAIVDTFFAFTVFYPLFIALLYFSFKHVPHSWQVGEKAVESVIRAPLYPVKTLIPVTCLMLLLQGVAELIRDLSTIFSRGKPEWS